MKGKKILKLTIEVIIIVFIFSYVIEKSGYYEYKLQFKKNMTEKEIKKFEEDVKSGKQIDMKNYLKDNTADYTNSLTRTTSNFSMNLNKYLIKVINKSLNIVNKLIK